ncbi:tyrosine-type recombinase/integrase [Nannocystis radixulma]|uniref:Tyrosine-type recombinase/integrase n=1 Tax=Nannocystis radixulma TaxID=2995305 RepID=A0ABT5BFM5_9BACT|nr:tyrosine-type recombinase/integrase [Nannocystis radixulma]MDC0672233.1 tyrosine-type recombinase/integrase [Nannocystis radixulma]
MITAAFVRECKPRATMYEVTCEALPGFILRVLPTGKKVALVRYRVNGKDQRVKIGLLGPALSIDEARRRGALLLANAATAASADEQSGQQAAGKPARLEQPESVPSQITTLREMAERFISDYVEVHLKSGSAANYKEHLETVILPEFGDRDFRSVTKAEIAALHSKLKKERGASTANYVLCVLGSLYTRIIEDWELVELRNPAQKIKRFTIPQRERFLSPEERRRVQAVILAGLKIPAGRKGHVKLVSVWALDLLALTGRRRNEILTMTWAMIDWQHSVLNLPDTKGGQLKVPVSARVLGLLKHIHDQTGNPSSGYVLRTAKGTRLRGVNRTWENIRKAAGIPDVRLHDLRHSFASDAIMSGVSLAAVGTLLGHKQERTTKRYTHLADDYLRRALETATDRIVEAATPIAALPPTPFEPMRDAQWKAIAPMVESTRGRCGGPRIDLRSTVDAIRWTLHTGAKWSEIPAQYGASTTCWRWYERWCSDGTWQQIAATLELSETEVGRKPERRPPRAKSRRGNNRPIDVTAVETSSPL